MGEETEKSLEAGQDERRKSERQGQATGVGRDASFPEQYTNRTPSLHGASPSANGSSANRG